VYAWWFDGRLALARWAGGAHSLWVGQGGQAG